MGRIQKLGIFPILFFLLDFYESRLQKFSQSLLYQVFWCFLTIFRGAIRILSFFLLVQRFCLLICYRDESSVKLILQIFLMLLRGRLFLWLTLIFLWFLSIRVFFIVSEHGTPHSLMLFPTVSHDQSTTFHTYDR